MPSGKPDGQKLYVRIAGQIRSMIEEGALSPGAKLPPLATLASDFSCSRATVREALSSLRGQGLIEFRHGDGTYVRTASVEMWMEPLEAAVLLSVNQVEQLVELETAILAGIATRAARIRGGQDFSSLAYALFQLECVNGHSEEVVAAEVAFYMTLAECAQNPLFENTLRVLQEALRSNIRTLRQRSDIGVSRCREIYDAIEAEDEGRAREIVYRYGAQMIQYIKEKNSLK
jgi:GntR family transcriptional regulator, transcriptional repressor for pyruvate dehydrogenase complex